MIALVTRVPQKKLINPNVKVNHPLLYVDSVSAMLHRSG
jgi:hypothetical protein